MYLTGLHVFGIKLISDLQLSFVRGESPRMWTVLLGENGLSKTTILQCIAMAGMGTNKANQLANVSSLHPLRRELRNGRGVIAGYPGGIRAEFVAPRANDLPGLLDPRDSQPVLYSELTRHAGWSDLKGTSLWRMRDGRTLGEKLNPLVEIRGRGLSDYFLAGYGVTRSLPIPDSSPSPRDPASDRVRSLFDPNWRVTATDFARRFPAVLVEGKPSVFAQSYERILNTVLIESGLLSGIERFRLSEDNTDDKFEQTIDAETSISVPASWLSHGYQSTVAWVADLVGQIILDQVESGAADLSADEFVGLVLVDELDLHLHPSWQRRLVSTLKRVFPKLQFIATTHSPIVLAGLEADEIIRLKRAPDGGVIAETNTTNPAFLTPTELLNEFFGFGDEFPSEVGQQMHEYMVLATNPFRDDDEEAQLAALRAELTAKNAAPSIQPTPRRAATGQS